MKVVNEKKDGRNIYRSKSSITKELVIGLLITSLVVLLVAISFI